MGCCCSTPPKPNEKCVDASHFQFIRAVGKGGFGTVHAVKGFLAIKKMAKAQLIASEWNMSAAWLERNILRLLQSPFVPKLYWAFQDEAYLYLVMDFLPGGDLGFYINKSAFNESTARYFAAELVIALEDLHQCHIVHHDVKPSNILLDASGHARLMDFGLSVILQPDSGYTRGGTPGFVSPESLNGESHGTEPDFFAFGATLYYFLKGRAPFQTEAEMIERHAEPASWNRIGNTAHDLIKNLLAYNVQDRISSWSIVQKHPFFESVDWATVRQRQGIGPITIDPNAAANFPADVYARDVLAPEEVVKIDDQTLFSGYEYDHLLPNEEIEEKPTTHKKMTFRRWDTNDTKFGPNSRGRPVDGNSGRNTTHSQPAFRNGLATIKGQSVKNINCEYTV